MSGSSYLVDGGDGTPLHKLLQTATLAGPLPPGGDGTQLHKLQQAHLLNCGDGTQPHKLVTSDAAADDPIWQVRGHLPGWQPRCGQC